MNNERKNQKWMSKRPNLSGSEEKHLRNMPSQSKIFTDRCHAVMVRENVELLLKNAKW